MASKAPLALYNGNIEELRSTDALSLAAIPTPLTGKDADTLDGYHAASFLQSVTPHKILSSVHSDTLAADPVLGDLIYGNSTPAWARLPGNTTITRKFLRQVGDSSISAPPAWDTLQSGDIPALPYEASGAIAIHAALITGVHGLVFTAGKALTLTESLTLNALPVGGLAVATGANTLGSLAVGLTTQILVGGGAGTVPAWGTDIPTGVTVGGKYNYRADGTDVAVADGGTNKSSWTQYCIPYASTTTALSEIAIGTAGQVLSVAAGATGYAWANALTNPMTNVGDMIYGGAAGAPTRLADVAVGSYLASGGVNTIPAWATLNQAAVAGLTTASSPVFASVQVTGTYPYFQINPPGWTSYIQSGVDAVGSTSNANFTTFLNPTGKGFSFSINNSSKLMVDTSGNVGIGTMSPRRRADILDTAGPQLRLTYTDNSVYVDQQANSSGQWVVTPSAGALNGTLSAAAGVITSGAVGCYVDRGDPTGVDWSFANFTFDSTWRDLDCSSIVPAGAKAIIFRIDQQAHAATSPFYMRQKGNTYSYNVAALQNSVANVPVIDTQFIVSCDSNRKVQYWGDSDLTVLFVTIRGWFI